jgi:hypothetical protein
MKRQDFFSVLKESFIKINPTSRNVELFDNILQGFDDFEIIDSFYQIKKSEKEQGLALEAMFFNKIVIIDLVFSRSIIDYTSVLINKINHIQYSIDTTSSSNEAGELSVLDNLEMTISYGGDQRSLVYRCETKRLPELLKIRNKIFSLCES